MRGLFSYWFTIGRRKILYIHAAHHSLFFDIDFVSINDLCSMSNDSIECDRFTHGT
jgi:hypothetical protein